MNGIAHQVRTVVEYSRISHTHSTWIDSVAVCIEEEWVEESRGGGCGGAVVDMAFY